MVTKIEDFVKMAGGSEIELPGFESGEQVTVRVKRPSLMDMAKNGRIPNPLLGTAAELFKNGVTKPISDGESFKAMSEVIMMEVKEALVEPSYEELEEAGVKLTDMQMFYIHDFVQNGVNALKMFREEQGTGAGDKPGRKTTKDSK